MNAAQIAQAALAALQVVEEFQANYATLKAGATTEDQATLDSAYTTISASARAAIARLDAIPNDPV